MAQTFGLMIQARQESIATGSSGEPKILCRLSNLKTRARRL
jgi:hypothetical protein